MLNEIHRLEREIETISNAIERTREREARKPVEQRRATIRFPAHVHGSAPDLFLTEPVPFEIRWLREACMQNRSDVVVCLPKPPNGNTPAFNLMLATPFFAATNSRSDGSKIVSMTLGPMRFDGEDFMLTYLGPRLTSSHADVFLGILHYVQQRQFGVPIEIPVRDFMKLIGRHASSGANRAALLREVKALGLGRFELEAKSPSGRKKVISRRWNLLGQYEYSDLQRDTALNAAIKLHVEVPIETAQLFDLNSWSPVDLNVRASLRGAIAKWLYGYLCSRGFQDKVSAKELLALSGCRQPISSFRGALRKAIDQLKDLKFLTANSFLGKEMLMWSKALRRNPSVKGVRADVVEAALLTTSEAEDWPEAAYSGLQ